MTPDSRVTTVEVVPVGRLPALLVCFGRDSGGVPGDGIGFGLLCAGGASGEQQAEQNKSGSAHDVLLWFG